MKVHRVGVEVVSNGFLIRVNEVEEVGPRHSGFDYMQKVREYRLVEKTLPDALARLTMLLEPSEDQTE